MMQAVIFDFDGVLADSEPLHYRSLRECLEPEGILVTEADYASFYLAYTDHDALRLALERAGASSGPERVQALARRKEAIFQRRLPEVQLYPGARELVTSLAERLPIGIASGALRGEIESILEAHALREPFSTIVGADEVVESKPSPEPYLAALERLRAAQTDLRAEDCLAVEDSMAGIEAARAAGMVVVGVTHSYPADRLASAHHVVGSLSQLELADLAQFFQSAATAGVL